MNTELTPAEQKDRNVNVRYQGGGDTVYALGLIGAWVYYISRGTTPQEKFLGFLKGLVWPAFLVYELFKFLEKGE